MRQRSAAAHEILVVDDGARDSTAEVAARHGVRCVRHGEPRSLNAARNTGLREARAPLIAFVDDDVARAPGLARRPGRRGARPSGGRGVRRADPRPLRRSPSARLRARGSAHHSPRSRTARTVRPTRCGARTSPYVARRSSASAPSTSASCRPHGDEEEWLERLPRRRGRVVTWRRAGLEHRRTAADARLAPLSSSGLRPGPGGAGQRPPARAGSGAGRRAARAVGMRVAHAAPGVPPGPGYGRARRGARGRDAAPASRPSGRGPREATISSRAMPGT